MRAAVAARQSRGRGWFGRGEGRHDGEGDGHLLKDMPPLGVDLQLGVHPGLLQILHKALTVGLQNFVCAYLYQRRGQAAQVGGPC